MEKEGRTDETQNKIKIKGPGGLLMDSETEERFDELEKKMDDVLHAVERFEAFVVARATGDFKW